MVLERMTQRLEELGLDAAIARAGVSAYGEAQVMNEDPAEQEEQKAGELGYDLATELGENVIPEVAMERLQAQVNDEFLVIAIEAFNRGREDQGWEPLKFNE